MEYFTMLNFFIVAALFFPIATGYISGFWKIYFNIYRNKSVGVIFLALASGFVAYFLSATFNPIQQIGAVILFISWVLIWATAGRGPVFLNWKQPLVNDNDPILKFVLLFFKNRTLGDQKPMNGVWWAYMTIRQGSLGIVPALVTLNPLFLMAGPIAWLAYVPVSGLIAKALNRRVGEGDGREFIGGFLSGLGLSIPTILILFL